MNAKNLKLTSLPAAPDPAPKSKPKKAAPRRRSVAAGNTWGLLLITSAVVATGVLAFPTFIILACGMPPAIAAALIDNRPGRHMSYCVMTANLAGIVPVLAALWFGGNSVGYAMMLMGDVNVWLSIYGAAAIGWAIIWLYTYIMEFILMLMAGYRVRKLLAVQGDMVEEWGDSIITAKAEV